MTGATAVQTGSKRLVGAAAVLLATQLIHGAVPADTESEGYVGLVVGFVFLVLNVAGLVGAAQRTPWAPKLLAGTGAAIAIGFVLYHGTPVKSPVTNRYLGEGVGAAPWLTVAATVAAAIWVAIEGRRVLQASRAVRV